MRDLRCASLYALHVLEGDLGARDDLLQASEDRDYWFALYAAIQLEKCIDPRVGVPVLAWIEHQVARRRTRQRARIVACALVTCHRVGGPRGARVLADKQAEWGSRLRPIEEVAALGTWTGHVPGSPMDVWPDGT